MATSGSTDFIQTRDEIIQDALNLIGVGIDGEPIEVASETDASRRFNQMVKAWQAEGLHLFARAEGSFTLTAAKQSYTMGGTSPDVSFRPLRVLSARYRDTSSRDIPMIRLPYEEYFDLPLKSSSGIPTQFAYTPGRDQGTFYVWPVIASVTTESIQLTYTRTLEDFDEATDNPDFPVEWTEALVYNLAFRLAPKYGLPLDERRELRAEAIAMKNTIMDWDVENASVYFQPTFQYGQE